MRVLHPFHPLSGQQFVCVGERCNRYGRRLLLQVEGEAICAVPPQWTDQVALDPELVISNRRALVRVEDLMELARVVDHLCKRIKENGR